MNKLNHHLRQYRHNDNSDLVAGYEREGTEAFVSCLEQEIAELKAQVGILKLTLNDMVARPFTKRMELSDQVDKLSPAQCLQSVKADVIKSTISDIEIGMANAHLDGDDILEYLNGELNKLREGES